MNNESSSWRTRSGTALQNHIGRAWHRDLTKIRDFCVRLSNFLRFLRFRASAEISMTRKRLIKYSSEFVYIFFSVDSEPDFERRVQFAADTHIHFFLFYDRRVVYVLTSCERSLCVALVKIFGEFTELILLMQRSRDNTQFRAIWSNLKRFGSRGGQNRTIPRRSHGLRENQETPRSVSDGDVF